MDSTYNLQRESKEQLLMNLLSERTWFELWASAKVQRLPFDTRWTRDEARTRLAQKLEDEGGLKRRLKLLNRTERHALQRLQAANGRLTRHSFTRDYGSIRRISRRDAHCPSAPWRLPGSTAERLWLYGFIEIVRSKPEQIVLTEEAARLLPPLPHPVRQTALPDAAPWYKRSDLTRDLAVWLGTLTALNVRPLHGRWLPPSALRKINTQMPRAEPSDGIRSELGCGRIRFLHYLAKAAGLIALQDGSLQPTTAAWRWLDLPEHERWTTLWSALESDRKTDGTLWQRYRLPELPDAAWDALILWLNKLAPGAYDLTSLIEAIRPYCPADPNVLGSGEGALWRGILALLDSVLLWVGWAYRHGNTVIICSSESQDDEKSGSPSLAHLTETADALLVELPLHPPLRPMVEILTYAHVADWRLIIDCAAVRRAAANGISALAIAESLASLCGRLPVSVLDRLQAWEREAKSMGLQQMLVLTADDPAMLDAICADRGLRSFVDAPLSAHHLAIRADQGEALVRRLERRNQLVTHHATMQPENTSSGALDPAAAAYAYLAIRVFQGLADFVSMPASIPAAAREAIAESVPPAERDALDRMAARTLDSLSATVQGYSSASPVESEAPDEIRAMLRHAYDTRSSITIDYFSPARGAVTTRQIEPLRWYERGGATDIEAWCGLEDDTRTFRLDRVLRIHPSLRDRVAESAIKIVESDRH